MDLEYILANYYSKNSDFLEGFPEVFNMHKNTKIFDHFFFELYLRCQ